MSRYKKIYSYYMKNTALLNVDLFDELLASNSKNALDSFKNDPDNKKHLYSSIMFRSLGDMYFQKYIWTVFHKNEINNQLLSTYIASICMELLINYNPRKGDSPFHMDTAGVGLQLMILITCNQMNIVDLLYPKILNSIVTGDVKRFATDDDGEIEIQKMFVLAMEMLSSEKQSTIDWASAGIPIERFYYDFVKEALYSTDETILKEWLNGLCDQHLKWCARAPDIMEEATFMGYEVPDQLHLWPFEYHAVINIRARHGLSTPVIDHPLLTNNFKNMAIPDFSQWEKPTWFTEVSEELIRINPDLAFTRDLF